MEIPNSLDLNDINYVLLVVKKFTKNSEVCLARSVIRSCSRRPFNARLVSYEKILKLTHGLGLAIFENGTVKVTAVGEEFLFYNQNSTYEITVDQKVYFAKKILFDGPLKSRLRDFFLNFSPDYTNVTFIYQSLDQPLPTRYNAIIHLLKVLGVIEEVDGLIRVKPEFLENVVHIREETNGLTQDELNQILISNQKYGEQAEEAILLYERKRLLNLKRESEAERVRKISHLDVSAGYDICSFNGYEPSLNYDRFIEVKASKQKELKFYWTNNERVTAEKLGDKYWIYFVGAIEQQTIDDIEPIMIQNPAKRIFEIPQVTVNVDKYLVKENGSIPLKRVENQGIKGYLL